MSNLCGVAKVSVQRNHASRRFYPKRDTFRCWYYTKADLDNEPARTVGVAVTNAPAASRAFGRTLLPFRPCPFRCAARALVTDDNCGSGRVNPGFRLWLGGGVALWMSFATRSALPLLHLARSPTADRSPPSHGSRQDRDTIDNPPFGGRSTTR